MTTRKTVTEILMQSPIGVLRLVARDGALTAIHLEDEPPGVPPEGTHPVLDVARRQLEEYFAGTRQAFDLPLEPVGTPFERGVWRALLNITLGDTTSYGVLAAGLGRATAARAVGAANRKNPLAIVVPCHRVVGASGALTGYAGGLARKAWLLAHERRMRGDDGA